MHFRLSSHAPIDLELAHDAVQVYLRNCCGGFSCYHVASSVLHWPPTHCDRSSRTTMDRSSSVGCGLSAHRHRVLRHANAKTGLLEINSDSSADISAERRDRATLDCHYTRIACASVYFYFCFHLRRNVRVPRVVAKSKELFCGGCARLTAAGALVRNGYLEDLHETTFGDLERDK